MLRGTTVLGTNVLVLRNLGSYDHLVSQLPSIQCVRWKRKPIWLPPAKSKIFKVTKRLVIPLEEELEFQRLYNHYRTYMNSLRSFFVQTYKQKLLMSKDNTAKSITEDDFITRTAINKTWNEEVAAERERRLQTERAKRMEEIMKKLEEKKERDILILNRVDAEIRKAKEESATFITHDNIDEAIELALQNVVNHNVAIDLNGTFYEEAKQVTKTVENV